MRTPDSQSGVEELDSQIERPGWGRQGRDKDRDRILARGEGQIRRGRLRNNGRGGLVGQAWRHDDRRLLLTDHAAVSLDLLAHPGSMSAAAMLRLLMHLEADSKRHKHSSHEYNGQACPVENAHLHKWSLAVFQIQLVICITRPYTSVISVRNE